MTLRLWPFNLPDGTALTSGNVKDSAGTAASVTNGGTSTALASADHPHSGGAGAKFVGAAASGNCLARLPFAAANPSAAASAYFWFSGVPTTTERILDFRHSAGVCAQISFITTGKLRILNTTGTAIYTTTANIPTGSLVRIEAWITVGASTGVTHIAMFNGDSQTPIESHDDTGQNLTANNVSAIDIGRITSANAQAVTVWVDDVRLDDGRTSEIGPYIVNQPFMNAQAVRRAAIW